MADDQDHQFVRWASIEGVNNVRKRIKDESLPQKQVIYRGKIKLHGVNSAINILIGSGGQLSTKFQSRNQFITSGGFGFAQWAEKQVKYFESVATHIAKSESGDAGMNVCVYGEWCGPGVQKGEIALNKLKNKVFAVFGLRINEQLVVDPDDIQKALTVNVSRDLPADIYVLPWYHDDRLDNGETVTLNFDNEEHVQQQLSHIQTMVNDIDLCDPWVKKHFGVEGAGEGIVWYPVSLASDNRRIFHEIFEQFSFKTKGDSHQVINKQVAATPTQSMTVRTFVDMFVTENRLQQGVTEICQETGVAPQFQSQFVEWMVNDVKKESRDELKESKLTWANIESVIRKQSSGWFTKQLNLLKAEKKKKEVSKKEEEDDGVGLFGDE